jgi:hypothetical protein
LVTQTNDEFRLNERGEYVQATRMRLQLLPAAALSVYSLFLHKKTFDAGLSLQYRFMMQYPFSNLSAILPMNQLMAGFIIQKK